MDYKRFAMVLGVMILLPLFLGLFFDAAYPSPKYEDFCGGSRLSMPEKMAPESCTQDLQKLKCISVKRNTDGSEMLDCEPAASARKCEDVYSSPEVRECNDNGGNAMFSTNDSCCQVFESCDYCSKNFNDAQRVYNRNLFFILAPAGLVVIIIGIFWAVEYLGAGFMFGGIITLFYATFRYFSDMSKMLRAIVILIELLIIIWLGYKKIGGNPGSKQAPAAAQRKRKR